MRSLLFSQFSSSPPHPPPQPLGLRIYCRKAKSLSIILHSTLQQTRVTTNHRHYFHLNNLYIMYQLATPHLFHSLSLSLSTLHTVTRFTLDGSSFIAAEVLWGTEEFVERLMIDRLHYYSIFFAIGGFYQSGDGSFHFISGSYALCSKHQLLNYYSIREIDSLYLFDFESTFI